PGDPERFVHVPTSSSANFGELPGFTLQELGLDVLTGPVVDFRLRKHLRMQFEPGSVPLLYPSHFSNRQVEWPRQGRKANAIVRDSETCRWVCPSACSVILRPLSSKEENRRLVHSLLDLSPLPGAKVGIENHLNALHKDRHGLPNAVARGLSVYLNSQPV